MDEEKKQKEDDNRVLRKKAQGQKNARAQNRALEMHVKMCPICDDKKRCEKAEKMFGVLKKELKK